MLSLEGPGPHVSYAVLNFYPYSRLGGGVLSFSLVGENWPIKILASSMGSIVSYPLHLWVGVGGVFHPFRYSFGDFSKFWCIFVVQCVDVFLPCCALHCQDNSRVCFHLVKVDFVIWRAVEHHIWLSLCSLSQYCIPWFTMFFPTHGGCSFSGGKVCVIDVRQCRVEVIINPFRVLVGLGVYF